MGFKFRGTLAPGELRICKPVDQKSYDEETLRQIKGAYITRKRDGWRMIVTKDRKGRIHLYTDGCNQIKDARFAHLAEELQTLDIPPLSLMVGEAHLNCSGKDNIGGVGSIFQTRDLRQAIEKQTELGKIHFMLFNILILDSAVCERTFKIAYDHIQFLFQDEHYDYISPIQRICLSLEKAQERVKRAGWEGLVIYDPDYVMRFRTDGKSPEKVDGCFKWKPKKEDDFLVRRFVMSDKRVGQLKELILEQTDPETGEYFECGKVGSFTARDRAYFQYEVEYPIVVQVEFEHRFEKTGKLRNAVYVRERPDKRTEDCVAPKSYPEKKKNKLEERKEQ